MAGFLNMDEYEFRNAAMLSFLIKLPNIVANTKTNLASQLS